MNEVQSTYYVHSTPRADFHREDFEAIIAQKGKDVLYEKAIVCPCKSEKANQLSSCLNCGGVGWIYVNPNRTRFIIHSMGNTKELKDWSETSRGMINVTASSNEQLCFMDRITVLDSRAIYTEAIAIKEKNGMYFSRTAYPVKKMLYCAIFVTGEVALRQLTEGVDYTIQGTLITFITTDFNFLNECSITLRYYHAPSYYLLDLNRESMETYEFTTGEKLIRLPISGTARRAHYVIDYQTLEGYYLNNNNQLNDNNQCESDDCGYSSSQSITFPIQNNGTVLSTIDFVRRRIIGFTNQTSVTITHGLGFVSNVIVYDALNNIIEAAVVSTELTVTVTFSESMSGIILIQG